MRATATAGHVKLDAFQRSCSVQTPLPYAPLIGGIKARASWIAS